jgi:hypothetical protein
LDGRCLFGGCGDLKTSGIISSDFRLFGFADCFSEIEIITLSFIILSNEKVNAYLILPQLNRYRRLE